MKLENQITGNIGLYYVCYKLSCMGWNVMPTARNARGVDIVAYNQSGSRFVGIQVKSLSKRNPVPLGKSLEKVMGDFWVIVNNVLTQPKAFILMPQEILEKSHKGVKEERISYWLQPTQYDTDEFREAWHRIGQGNF